MMAHGGTIKGVKMVNLKTKLYRQYYEKEKDNLNKMLKQVIDDATNVGIPISQNIDKKVYVDFGEQFKNRAGFCEWTINNIYKIHITDRLLVAKDSCIKNIIAHEVIHTCMLCKNHYFVWKKYCKIMNNAYGYNITEKVDGWNSIERKS